jgi:hypothetical protein
VHKRFGSWSAALHAAGYTPRRTRERPVMGIPPTDVEELEALLKSVVRAADPEDQRQALYSLAEAAIAWAESMPDPNFAR